MPRILLALIVAFSISLSGCNKKEASETKDKEATNATSSQVASDDSSNSVGQQWVRGDSQQENDAAAKEIADSISKNLERGLATLQMEINECPTESEKKAVFDAYNPVPEFLAQSLKVTEVYPESPAAFEVALSGLAYAADDNRDALLNFMLDDWPHKLNHRKIIQYLLNQPPSESVEGFLRKCVVTAPQGIDQAEALLGFKTYFDQLPLFSYSIRLSKGVDTVLSNEQIKYIHTERTDAQTDETAGYLQRVIDEYSDEKYVSNGMGSAETFGDVAKGELYELRNLNVGDVAPEISANDLDGVPFKLSEYRGKVVMLDFWGHWCPPCRRMYPHERDIVERLTGLPFALIGVNSDEDLEVARKAVQEDPLPWRNFWNGPQGTAGPISTQWNISDWPTFYLIDGEGVIRYKGVLGDDITDGLKVLLAELGHDIDLNPIEKVASN